MQSFIYLKVKHHANVAIHSQSYRHIQSLSFNWHCNKKTGSILRILDRGGTACDNIVSQIILSLLPGVLESFSVFLIFIWKFDHRISITITIGIIIYIFMTRSVTVQRKKFRLGFYLYYFDLTSFLNYFLLSSSFFDIYRSNLLFLLLFALLLLL